MDVYNMVKDIGYVKTGKFYGVSDKAVAKWLKKENLNPLEQKSTEDFLNIVIELKLSVKTIGYTKTFQNKILQNYIKNFRTRHRLKNLKIEEINILNGISEKILNPENGDIHFEQSIENLDVFIKKNNRTPKNIKENESERLLYIFLKNQYQRNNPEKISKIEALFEKYGILTKTKTKDPK